MKKISISVLLLLALTTAVMAQKINIVPTSTLKGPQGQVANAVIELSRSAGFDITPIQKGGCGEAVDYFENTKDPVAIVWSDTMIKNTKVTKQNCIINFDNASAIAVTYAPYDLCVLKGNKLEPNKTYKLGNNKFNPAATIRRELNKNKMGINFLDVTYDSSSASVNGLINKEIDAAYTATGNASAAIKAGSIDCLYTTGAATYGQKTFNDFVGQSDLNNYKLGMIVFTRNLSLDQVNELRKSLEKDWAKQLSQQDMVGSKVAPDKADVENFINTATRYSTYE